MTPFRALILSRSSRNKMLRNEPLAIKKNFRLDKTGKISLTRSRVKVIRGVAERLRNARRT